MRGVIGWGFADAVTWAPGRVTVLGIKEGHDFPGFHAT